MLLSEAFDNYARDVIIFRNQSRKTMEMNNIALKSLLKHVGDINVSELGFQDVRKWKEKLEDENKSVNTIRGYIIKLRCILGYLRRMKLDSLDPDSVPVPKRQQTLPTWVSPEDVTRLIDSTPMLRAKTIISFLYASGVRVSELCSLNRDDLHDGRFSVVGKGGKTRLCFYDRRSTLYLERYLKGRKDSNPALFVQRVGDRRINKGGVEEIFRCARLKAGFDKYITPHTMRHSFSSDLMQKGLPIHSLQMMLGHSQLSSTQIYLHVSNPQLAEQYERYHTI